MRGEWHDGETAKLQQRAEPEIGDAAPAQDGAMVIGFEADDCAERSEDQRQGDHDGNEPGWNAKLHDHDTVERADE